MTRAKRFVFRAVGLPTAYALLTAILPFIGNYDNPERFLRFWGESFFSLMLVVFLVIYVVALRSALTDAPASEAPLGDNTDSGSHLIGANGLPLRNGTDSYGNPGGVSMEMSEVKSSDD